MYLDSTDSIFSHLPCVFAVHHCRLLVTLWHRVVAQVSSITAFPTATIHPEDPTSGCICGTEALIAFLTADRILCP